MANKNMNIIGTGQGTARPVPKKYNIIYADPPWPYNFPETRSAKIKDYNTMSIHDICKLRVKDIADDNCLLFLWVTFRNLFEAKSVIEDWGFAYKTCAFVWVKKTKHWKDFYGMGEYTRANPEICLVARKGKNLVLSHSVRQLQYAGIEKHSAKPDIFRKAIVELCGDIPRIELFARQRVGGWDAWGNEIQELPILGKESPAQGVKEICHTASNRRSSMLNIFFTLPNRRSSMLNIFFTF